MRSYCLQLALILLAPMLLLPGTSRSELFGVTETSLVIIDPDNPNDTIVVGSLNLPSDVSISASPVATFDADSLSLIGLARDVTTQDQLLVSINPSTGDATVLANLGTPSSAGFIESLEYVNTLKSLVVSTNPLSDPAKSTQLLRLILTGSTSLLTSNTLDNDVSAFDPSSLSYYTADIAPTTLSISGPWIRGINKYRRDSPSARLGV